MHRLRTMLQEARLLTVQETASLLKVHRRTLERWERSGQLVPIRLGPGTVRYRREDIDRFLAQKAAS